MSKTKHIHKYFKIDGSNHKIFKCGLDNCSFFIHPGLFETLIGKISYCNNCEHKFVITEQSLTEDRPICDDCKFKSGLKNIGIDNSIIDEVKIEDLDGFLSIKGID